jgi:hypothetical protein
MPSGKKTVIWGETPCLSISITTTCSVFGLYSIPPDISKTDLKTLYYLYRSSLPEIISSTSSGVKRVIWAISLA